MGGKSNKTSEGKNETGTHETLGQWRIKVWGKKNMTRNKKKNRANPSKVELLEGTDAHNQQAAFILKKHNR